MTGFTDPMFNDEDKAREALEALRWPDGPYCPHCGNSDQDKIAKVEGKKQSHRPGLYYCNECKGQFTVTVGTVFERSKVPLTKWWLAAHLLNSSKKGISAHQIHRTINVTYKTAWFMMHRLREAMADMNPGALGGSGKVIEADTTYVGGKEHNKHRNKRNSKNIGGKGKQIVHSLVERDGGARSHHIANISGKTLRPLVVTNVSRKSTLMTDTAGGYMGVGKEFARHEMVDHEGGEYVRHSNVVNFADGKSPIITTNTVESYFATLKRGINGIYHHVSEAHLKRYLAEFDFRYNNRAKLGVTDGERTALAMKGIEGKRLTYRPAN